MLKVPTQSITVIRDGKPLIPKIGKPFEFTDEELKDIEKSAPDAVRSPKNETTVEENQGDDSQGEQAKAAATKKTAAKKGDPDL